MLSTSWVQKKKIIIKTTQILWLLSAHVVETLFTEGVVMYTFSNCKAKIHFVNDTANLFHTFVLPGNTVDARLAGLPSPLV